MLYLMGKNGYNVKTAKSGIILIAKLFMDITIFKSCCRLMNKIGSNTTARHAEKGKPIKI